MSKKRAARKKLVVKSLIGCCLIALGVLAIVLWVDDFLLLFRGSIGILLLAAGAVVLALSRE